MARLIQPAQMRLLIRERLRAGNQETGPVLPELKEGAGTMISVETALSTLPSHSLKCRITAMHSLHGLACRQAFGNGIPTMGLKPTSQMNWEQTFSRTIWMAILMGTFSTIQSTWMMTTMQYSIGSMLMMTTMVYGTISKSIATTTWMTMRAKKMETSSLVQTVSTMTMTETMQMQMVMDSTRLFGIEVL